MHLNYFAYLFLHLIVLLLLFLTALKDFCFCLLLGQVHVIRCILLYFALCVFSSKFPYVVASYSDNSY